MTTLVSVVTPTYRPASYWLRQAEWLSQQTMPGRRFEWIVVDDHQDENAKAIASLSVDFRVLHIPPWKLSPRISICSAFNDGIIASRGELVHLMADYMQPTPTVLERHWELYCRFGPDVAISGIVLPDVRRAEGHSEIVVKDPEVARHMFWGGRNDSVSLSALLRVNGFDERLDGYRGMMDAELISRLMNLPVTYVLDQLAGAGMHAHVQGKDTGSEQERDAMFAPHWQAVHAGEHWAAHGRTLYETRLA